jgi:nitroimidazol reductase NimA-like FMN-containing flavoprotein (pyridoxamine 5'-phosphate oxidase superfamily)
MHQRPQFLQLDGTDIQSVLARNRVGRLAFTWGGEVDIRPLHYVYSAGNLYGRASPGAKFVGISDLPARVAFEVDEVESGFRWTSVIVRGHFRVLSEHGPDADEWREAVQLLRRAVKGSFADADPTPERNVIFCITLEEATGRAAR